jgi:hypothetical protein
MGIYTIDTIINGITFSNQDEINMKFRNLFYDFFIATKNFATSGTQSPTTGKITTTKHIIKKDSATGNKLIIDNVNFSVTVTYNVSSAATTLYITNDATNVKTTMNLKTFLNNLHYTQNTDTGVYTIGTTDTLKLIYRGYRTGSFFVNATVNGITTQNMRMFEFLKLYSATTDEYCVGLRNITVAAAAATSTHVDGDTALNGIASCVDNSSLAARGFTLTGTEMPTYGTKYYAADQINTYDWNSLMKQRFTGDYLMDDTVIVGNTSYYHQFFTYKIEGGIYYCFKPGYLLRVG